MTIYLEKFGTVLTSRQAGREAYLAYAPTLAAVSDKERVEIDFSNIFSIGPSWADEFIRPLFERFGNRMTLLPSDNASVVATLSFLEQTLGRSFHRNTPPHSTTVKPRRSKRGTTRGGRASVGASSSE